MSRTFLHDNFSTSTLIVTGQWNFTTTPPKPVYTMTSDLSAIDIISIILSSLVCLLGTIGNALVIWVFGWRKRKTRKRFELLLFILAITDFFSSVIVPALFLYGTGTQFKQWHFGYYGCKLIMSIFPVTVSFSQGILILISYERYKSIHDPFGGSMGRTFITSWLSVTVILSFLLVSPYVYAVDLTNVEEYGINTCNPEPNKFDHLFVYTAGNVCRDFFATLSMVILGVLTNRSLNKGGVLGGIKVYEKRQKNALKARNMLIVVVCVFSFCVIPLDLYQLIIYTIFKVHGAVSKRAYAMIQNGNTLLTTLQIANSATNILIYSRMHRDFTRQLCSCVRRGLQRVVTNRTTSRSVKSTSVDSLPTHGALLAIFPITPEENALQSNVVDFPETTQLTINEICSVI